MYLPYNPLNNCALEEAAKAALAGINKKYNTRLSLNRLRSYLRYYLSCTGVDAVEINLLHGAPSLQDAGIYYYQIDSEQLAKRHHTYCIRLLRKVVKEYDCWLPQYKSRRIGSQLQLLEGNVKNYFKQSGKKLMPTDCKVTNRYWNFTMCTRSLSFIYLIFQVDIDR